MLLSELFGYVVTLDSFPLNLGNAAGTVDPIHYPKLIRATNLAMAEMYKEFPIKVSSLYIQLYSQISTYSLTSKYAQTNTDSTELIRYIEDTSFNPFQDDVLKIERVFNEIGEVFPLNDETNEFSLYTPSYNTIQHPYPSNENTIIVEYRALSVDIPLDATILSYEIDLPRQLINLMLLWIDYKLLSGTNKKQAQEKLGEYLGSLAMAKSQNLFRVDETVNEKILNNGWV